MEKRILTTCLILFTGPWLHAGVFFTLENPGCEWGAVLGNLRDPGLVMSAFKESRSNRFHRHPVRLEGVIRWDPDLGLSIRYEEPNPAVVNVTDNGIFITKEDETRPLGAGNDQTRFFELFSHLFSWDIAWLSRNFTSEGVIDADHAWELRLLPANDELTRIMSELVLSGDARFLNGIRIDLQGGRAVQIDLFEQVHPDTFSPEELKSSFPFIDE